MPECMVPVSGLPVAAFVIETVNQDPRLHINVVNLLLPIHSGCSACLFKSHISTRIILSILAWFLCLLKCNSQDACGIPFLIMPRHHFPIFLMVLQPYKA